MHFLNSLPFERHYKQHINFVILGNYQAHIRSQAVSNIVQLAEIVQDKSLTSAPFINQFETIDLGTLCNSQADLPLGYAQCVSNLFHHVGPNFSLFAIPLLAGLEIYQTHSNWTISTICTSAISQILWECKDKLNSNDRISVVWSLFFALGARIEQTYASSTRLSIINGI